MSNSLHTPELPSSQLGGRGVRFASGGTGSISRSLLRSSRAARFTPYRKTPGHRRLLGPFRTPGRKGSTPGSEKKRRQGLRTPQRVNENDHKDIVQQTWKTFKVTPLYNFTRTPRAFRKYASQLSAYVQAETKKGTVILPDEQADKATFKLIKGFKVDSGDSDAVEITLKQKAKRGDPEKVVLKAILCCCHRKLEDMEQIVDQSFVVLPVMLVKGTVVLTRPLCAWLQLTFGCGVSTMRFNPLSLCWLVAMWSGFIPDQRGKPVQLVYETPRDVKNLSKITMDIDSKDCKELWDSIHEGGAEVYDEDEMETFLNGLEAHFYPFFKIHLSALKLSRVGTAVAYVGSEGRLKVFGEEFVLMVLGKLTELALEEIIPHKC